MGDAKVLSLSIFVTFTFMPFPWQAAGRFPAEAIFIYQNKDRNSFKSRWLSYWNWIGLAPTIFVSDVYGNGLAFSQPHRNKTCLKWFFHFNCENDLWVLGLIQQKRWSTFYLGNVSSTSAQLSSKIMATHRLPNTCQIAIIKHKQHVVGEGVSNIMEASLLGELVWGFKFQTVTLPQGEVTVGEFE